MMVKSQLLRLKTEMNMSKCKKCSEKRIRWSICSPKRRITMLKRLIYWPNSLLPRASQLLGLRILMLRWNRPRSLLHRNRTWFQSNRSILKNWKKKQHSRLMRYRDLRSSWKRKRNRCRRKLPHLKMHLSNLNLFLKVNHQNKIQYKPK